MIGAAQTTIGTEIERKFLLRDTGIVAGLTGRPLVQGYFGGIDGWSLRLRTAQARGGAPAAWLTLKSGTAGAAREEIESPVDPAFATRLLAALSPAQLISKLRYCLPAPDGLSWEIDRFLERHHGLWLAEIELPRADYPLALPAWLGPEVTDDPGYRNAALAVSPGGGALPPAPAELRAVVDRLLAETGQRPALPPEPALHAG